MTRLLTMLAALALAAPLLAAPETHNTLTPEEIRDGWILLFDGETTFGWKIQGDAKVVDGALVLGGEKAATATPTTIFGDYELDMDFRAEGKESVEVFAECGGEQGGSVLPSLGKTWLSAFMRAVEGSVTGGIRLGPGRVEQQGGDFTALGPVILTFMVPAGTTLSLRDVRLKPLGLQSLFNGKDLTGWKEIPDHKSKFAVTEKGELNVKDGNGDLQSEGEYDDFVLQLDVISNGDRLNSGVFFRCLPGKFWSGYESQIRNQWDGEDRAKPVDFGTGGLYNRQKTRKVVSSDREWFTKTIVARGTHIAIWVNGYQTVDFTDTAPAAENARNGSKTGKGPISLQGHDPTTDLSFRSIRIGQIPK